MRKMIGYVLELAGLGAVAYAGYVLTPALGYALAGALLIVAGVVMGAKP
jgi:hypothetical protein